MHSMKEAVKSKVPPGRQKMEIDSQPHTVQGNQPSVLEPQAKGK